MKFIPIVVVTLAFSAITLASPMRLTRRRFGQEHTPEADKTFQDVKDLAQGSDKEAQAGNLSGAMVRALLAKAPACDQQDRADEVIDLGRTFGGDKEKQFIKVAKTYRQLERNTPGVGQASELCNKEPKNKELKGLVQAQDPTGQGTQTSPAPAVQAPTTSPALAQAPTTSPSPAPAPATSPATSPAPAPAPATSPATSPAPAPAPATSPAPADSGNTNVAETNPVGGVKMPKIEQKNGDFIVNGNGFNGNLDAAHSRQCDIQHNLCFNKFNSGDRSFAGSDCDNQTNVCKSGPAVFA